MRNRTFATLLVALTGCGFSKLPPLAGDAASGDDATHGGDAASSDDGASGDDAASGGDAASGNDAPASGFSVTASPSAFDLYVTATLDTLVTVTNTGGTTSGIPVLAVTGLTLGTMTFTSSTCTTGLAPGASCTATGHLAETANGTVNFQVVATASPGGTGMAALSVTATCLATCGGSQTTSCCASAVVPGNATGATLAGVSFYRSYDVATDFAYASMGYPATVSDVRLDHYDVTVGRFRAFVNAGLGTQARPPTSAAGARTLNGTANQGGWDPGYNANLAANSAALATALKCDSTRQTWTDSAGVNENLPMNCITWYEATAFCLWDNGFLPTEAEWNYAAAGGSQQRAYPWSPSGSPGSLSIDCTYANYYINNNPSIPFCVNGGRANRVGDESPKGDGRWGQSDLSGNVSQWVLDWYAVPYPTTSCNNCANLTATTDRVFRGAAFLNEALNLRGASRYGYSPSGRTASRGVRCARTP